LQALELRRGCGLISAGARAAPSPAIAAVERGRARGFEDALEFASTALRRHAADDPSFDSGGEEAMRVDFS